MLADRRDVPMQAKIVVLAGDGIGPEVTDEAQKILEQGRPTLWPYFRLPTRS
jgi:isocitrate/isopropylmalate dehydrogenase